MSNVNVVHKRRYAKMLEHGRAPIINTLSSLIQVTEFLLKKYGISLKILLFQSGLCVKVCHVYCVLLQSGLKPFSVSSKQWWRLWELLCSVFQPGLWVISIACLVIQKWIWKKSGMSPNTTWLVLKRKEYSVATICRGPARLSLGFFKPSLSFSETQWWRSGVNDWLSPRGSCSGHDGCDAQFAATTTDGYRSGRDSATPTPANSHPGCPSTSWDRPHQSGYIF